MNDVSWLKGSITPIVTPFSNQAVDYEAYARLVDWQIINGGHGVLVNGTTAEPSLLSVAERNRLVEVAVEAAAGRVPVLAATGYGDGQAHCGSALPLRIWLAMVSPISRVPLLPPMS